jgi:tetratricopeptide (TPR) repeat protein
LLNYKPAQWENCKYIIIIFLIVVSCAAFGRIAGNDFINFDDDVYINAGSHIKSGINTESIKWVFTAVVAGNWHPLTILSHMLDWRLFGANASGHHMVSLFLHIGSVLFLFLFLNKTTKNIWPSAFAAALFAFHPLRVESVAWAAERKDVLSMFFGMACLYAYAFYSERSKFTTYLLCLILFILSLMSKPMMVTLPFVLMLLDYWPLKRWQKAMYENGKRFNSISRLIWDKVPFILLTIASSIVTLWAQNKGGAVVSADYMPFLMRGANAIISYAAYLEKFFWPHNLAIVYPYEASLLLWKVLISIFILIVITAVVIYLIIKLPFLFVGWFWYLGTLIPVIGLVQVGSQPMADRYTYLPSVGIAIILAWGIGSFIKNEDLRKKILFPMGAVFIAILSLITWQQCGYWKNSITLFTHVLKVTRDNSVAHKCFAKALDDKGRNEEAFNHYNQSIRLNPHYADAYLFRGIFFDKLGQYQLAVEDYNNAIGLSPDYVDAFYNRGVSYAAIGQYQQAYDDYNKAISRNPDYAVAYNARGAIYLKFGQYRQAIEDFNRAIQLNPADVKVYNNRGILYTNLGQQQLAIEDFSTAISLKDDYANAYNNRAFVYLNQGNIELGCYDAQKACALGNCTTFENAKSKGNCR